MTGRRLHLGKKTAAFDVLPADLMVVEHAEGVSAGRAARFIGLDAKGKPSFEDLKPDNESGKPASGFRAFSPANGGVYRLEGVVQIPTRVERLVRYTTERGFEELSEAEFQHHLQAMEPLWPEITGTSKGQVEFALSLRQKAIEAVQAAGRTDLLGALRRRSYAAWFLGRKHHTGEQWIADLEAVLQTPTTPPRPA